MKKNLKAPTILHAGLLRRSSMTLMALWLNQNEKHADLKAS